MPKNSDLDYAKLSALLEKRGKKIIAKFGEAAASGVSNSELLSILTDVKAYWKDTYRPALASLACEAVGGQPKVAAGTSLAITLAAAGIGIHDDIIDNSSSKHFRMTILGLYNRDAALLAGDLLIVKGLTNLQEVLSKNYQPDKVKDIIETCQRFLIEICEAEFMELLCRKNLDTELEHYLDILWKSTADTEACTRFGAILGGGSKFEIQALGEIGRRLGLMSRLTDDLKDTLNIEGNLPHRLKYESVPLPILFAAKSSNKKFSEIKSVLKKSRIAQSDIKTIIECCFDTEAFHFVHSIAEKNAKEASRQLRLLKCGKARATFKLIIKKLQTEIVCLPG
jgi:geranylgeranyl pyrophosphate synthase